MSRLSSTALARDWGASSAASPQQAVGRQILEHQRNLVDTFVMRPLRVLCRSADPGKGPQFVGEDAEAQAVVPARLARKMAFKAMMLILKETATTRLISSLMRTMRSRSVPARGA